MLNQQQLPEYLEREMPELSTNLHEKEQGCNSAFEAMHHLVDYTRSKIDEQNFKAAKKCFNIAEKAYNSGNTVVKNAIENIYVYSFSHFLLKDDAKRRILMGLMPATLFTLYMKQMLNSHI
jgi:hypothetical protein